jgi:hypothetical protein
VALPALQGANSVGGGYDAISWMSTAGLLILCEREVRNSVVDLSLAREETTMNRCDRNGKPFVLNPSPATRLSDSLLSRCPLIAPNQYELATVLRGTAIRWENLLSALPGRVVTTAGKEGAYRGDRAGALQHQPAFPVTPIDGLPSEYGISRIEQSLSGC